MTKYLVPENVEYDGARRELKSYEEFEQWAREHVNNHRRPCQCGVVVLIPTSTAPFGHHQIVEI